VGDTGSTPFGRSEPLVDLHATALDDLIQDKLLIEAPPVWSAALTTVVLLMLAAFTSRITSVRAFATVIVGLIVLLLAASAALLFWRDVVIYAITPVTFLVLSLIAESAAARVSRRLKRFGSGRHWAAIFPPRVLQEVLQNPNAFQAARSRDHGAALPTFVTSRRSPKPSAPSACSTC
jgi:hypothetical protein